MVVFPNAKINLGLHILEKQTNGYHAIETCMLPVFSCFDVLEIVHSNTFEFKQYGATKGIAAEHNIVSKAYQLFNAHHPIGNVKINLIKKIPNGAGLGGGSADAAFTLLALNKMFDCKLESKTLHKIALKLGSDVPFFIENKTAIARGQGEILEPIAIDLRKYKTILIKPETSMPTALAFSLCKPDNTRQSIKNKIASVVEVWSELLENDFEKIVFEKIQSLREIKTKLYENGAKYAALSGSGSCMFGLFETQKDCSSLQNWAIENNFFYHE
jgi:4-diphosphocytidyl-2-C-methyl-D-erythritol kinase